jgi:uroporphyrinogen-III synthase
MPARHIVLLTRPVAESVEFAARLGDAARIVISPVITIENIRTSIDLDRYTALIFGSKNAVHAVAGQNPIAGKTCYTVGDRTAAIAREYGAVALSAGGNADDLVAMILTMKPASKLLFVRGVHTRGEVAHKLNNAGLDTDSVILYDQKLTPLGQDAVDVLTGCGKVILPIFSPRTARILSDQLRHISVRVDLVIVALSEAVLKNWDGPDPVATMVAKTPTAAAMLKETLDCFAASS